MTILDRYKGYRSHIVCFLIMLISFLLMLRYAGSVSLWYDDLYTIAFVGKGLTFSQIAENIASDTHSNTPLFYLFAAFWLRIAPFGTLFLKLPSIFFSAAGIYLCGVVARKLKGNRAAVFATLFAGTSSFLIINGAYTFRSYGLMFLLVILLFYFYILRTEQNGRLNKYVFIFGGVATVLCFTHYFGLLVVAAMFVCDLVLLVLKKLNWKHFLSYILLVALYLPYFIPVLTGTIERQGTFWAETPTVQSLILVTKDLFSRYDSVYLFFCLGLVVSIIMVFSPYLRSFLNMDKRKVYMCIVQIYMVVCIVGLVFAYSRFVNPEGSFFVHRYFISVVPFALVVAAIGIESALDVFLIGKPKQLSFIIVCAVICVVGLRLGGNVLENVNEHASSYNEPFEQAIEWIYEQEDAHKPDTLVMTTAPELGVMYYVTQNGQRPPLNLASDENPDTRLTEKNYSQWNKIYRFDGHKPVLDKTQKLLDEKFELVYSHWKWGTTVFVYERIQTDATRQ